MSGENLKYCPIKWAGLLADASIADAACDPNCEWWVDECWHGENGLINHFSGCAIKFLGFLELCR